MSAKLSILFALIVSLLAAPLAQRTAALSAMPMPRCAMATCVNGCCAMMPCCAKSQRAQSQPEQAPIPRRTDGQLPAIIVRIPLLFHALPAAERTFVILDEASAGHTLPPLAMNCIQLI
jgi:hypothetical protein